MAVLVTRFKRFLGQATKGDEYAYHSGRLAEDRLDMDGEPNEIDVLAKLARTAYEEGDVHLLSQRVGSPGSNTFLYIARKR